MNRQLSCAFLRSGILALTLTTALADAAVIFDSGVTELTVSDPDQAGRLNRNGVVSDWSTQKPFPGIVNSTLLYHYTTYTISDVLYPYIQVSFDDIAGTALTFASAYLNSYQPNGSDASNGLDINYLGDAGASGNYFGTDPRVFQVIIPSGSNLVIAVNGTGTNANPATGQPYRVIVEGFTDTQFHDVIPEPASLGLIGLSVGFAAIIGVAGKRRVVLKQGAD
ncbi:MAG: PEP-CTERM sorting domain-containing protein [Acidobacteriaceae bacterium]|nr:PEP-CTERM sorting domain-containing protein [Acidobacteriaceae bacterium]MBV9442052.1 PEP-CTERM sorting domain-containing protein [Acidobacteriaceae bacterium]